jgi:hypothetical protein
MPAAGVPKKGIDTHTTNGLNTWKQRMKLENALMKPQVKCHIFKFF